MNKTLIFFIGMVILFTGCSSSNETASESTEQNTLEEVSGNQDVDEVKSESKKNESSDKFYYLVGEVSPEESIVRSDGSPIMQYEIDDDVILQNLGGLFIGSKEIINQDPFQFRVFYHGQDEAAVLIFITDDNQYFLDVQTERGNFDKYDVEGENYYFTEDNQMGIFWISENGFSISFLNGRIDETQFNEIIGHYLNKFPPNIDYQNQIFNTVGTKQKSELID